MNPNNHLNDETRCFVLAAARRGYGWEDICARLKIYGPTAKAVIRQMVLNHGKLEGVTMRKD